MLAEANKKVVQQFYEAGNRGDMETCFELIAEDIEWTNMGKTLLSGTYCGKTELMEKLLGPLFAKLKQGIHMQVHCLIAEGDYVVAQTSGAAETLDGQPYNNSYCWIIRVHNGKFTKVTEYLDTELVTSVFG